MLDPSDERPEARASLQHWLAIQLALALRPGTAAELLRRSGDPRAALRALRRGARPGALELDRAWEALRRSGAVAVPLLSAAYPARLANLSDPAPLLLVRGEVAALSAPAVAMVGSRAATTYGLSVAHRIAGELARAGQVVVSGLARGIDAAAHRGALEAGGRTVAVQACGPDRVYPAEHRALADEIACHGAVVTELPPATRPLPHHFPLRNRLISGLSSALVVVEARERSGSLITAGHALDQGIDIFAVPGPISAPTSAGPNRLLRDGAYPLLEVADVLEVLALGTAVREPWEPGESDPRSGGGAQQIRIVDALAREPATRDELGARLDRSPEQLALDLLELELEGRVVEDRDGRLRVLRP